MRRATDIQADGKGYRRDRLSRRQLQGLLGGNIGCQQTWSNLGVSEHYSLPFHEFQQMTEIRKQK
jgi:hypothetical protein